MVLIFGFFNFETKLFNLLDLEIVDLTTATLQRTGSMRKVGFSTTADPTILASWHPMASYITVEFVRLLIPLGLSDSSARTHFTCTGICLCFKNPRIPTGHCLCGTVYGTKSGICEKRWKNDRDLADIYIYNIYIIFFLFSFR